MKKYLRFATSLSLAIIMALSGAATAFAATQPAPPPPGGTFAQRLAQRKAERGIQLDARDQQRLTSRCAQAQSSIRSLQQVTTPVIANRSKVYQRISAKLWVIIGELKLAGKDTFNLEKQLSALAGKTSNFQATSANYQQVIDDTLVVNCQADVVGFKALLDTARLYQASLRDQSADIRNYVTNEIKTTLANHVSELQPKPDTGGQ